MVMARILLVDDARLMAEMSSTAIGRSSYDLRPLRPGQDIVALARSCRPAVVLLRDGEACPDGLSACRALKQDPQTRSIPVIYIGLALDRERYREAGVDVFIPRPMTRHELREALRRVLKVKDRIALRRRVDLDVELQLGGIVLRGRCANLSLTGAYLLFERSLPVGAKGRLRFQAAGRLLELEVELVREGPGLAPVEAPGSTLVEGFGARFLGIDSDTAGYLSRFVRSAGDRRLHGGDALRAGGHV